jgi:plasmid stabilization system protein ParE
MGEARLVNIRYTLSALRELKETLSFIADRTPQGARNVQARIQQMVALIALNPKIGVKTGKRLRRLTVFPYPYLIFYSVTDHDVIIHGVRHSARHPSTMPS